MLYPVGVENFQGWSLHVFSEQPTPLPACLYGEIVSSYIQPRPLLFWLLPAVSHPAMYCRAFLGLHPCQYWQVAVRFPPQLSSTGWTSSGPSASPHRASLPAPIILVTLCWTHPSLSMSLLYWGAPDWMQYSRWVLRDNSFPWSTTCVFVQLRTLLPVSVARAGCRVSSACSRPRAPGLSGRAALQPGSPQPGPRQGVLLSLPGQNFAFGLVEFQSQSATLQVVALLLGRWTGSPSLV